MLSDIDAAYAYIERAKERATLPVIQHLEQAEDCLTRYSAGHRWQKIETAPKDEGTSFLVLWKSELYETCVVQVSRFQGDLYLDVMDANIDYGDRILGATHWMPLPPTPEAK